MEMKRVENIESKKKPVIIGIAGGSASGKTTVCEEIKNRLGDKRVCVISQDSFYKNLSEEERKLASESKYNFDHPEAFDYVLLRETMTKIKEGLSVEIPVYDFKTHSRTSQTEIINSSDVYILEGILVFYDKFLRDLFEMKIFVDTDCDVRLGRRIERDTQQRGRELTGILKQYFQFVKPCYDDYIIPTKKYSNLIIPFGGENYVAINLLISNIKSRLDSTY